ncbi:MAG: hypothetical protein ACXWR1_19475 [Bdellovibrionota bacterium]
MKLAILFALVSTPAFAGGHGLSFEEIREACQNPGKFQNQLAPTNLQISCEEHVSRWLPYVAKEVQLPRSRYIISSLTSDKYQVSPSQNVMNVDMQSAQCPSFKEVLEITSFTKATSCDEILGWKGSEQDFCADILDRARHGNPKMVQINDTGRVVEFCTDNGKGQGQDQGKGKGQGQGQGKQH